MITSNSIFVNSTSKEDVSMSQIYRDGFDITYLPVLHGVLNRLTKQAANVMVASNKVLDRFFYNVLQGLYPKILYSFRRFCKLSIFTSGTRCNRMDSFFNSPHIMVIFHLTEGCLSSTKSLYCCIKALFRFRLFEIV